MLGRLIWPLSFRQETRVQTVRSDPELNAPSSPTPCPSAPSSSISASRLGPRPALRLKPSSAPISRPGSIPPISSRSRSFSPTSPCVSEVGLPGPSPPDSPSGRSSNHPLGPFLHRSSLPTRPGPAARAPNRPPRSLTACPSPLPSSSKGFCSWLFVDPPEGKSRRSRHRSAFVVASATQRRIPSCTCTTARGFASARRKGICCFQLRAVAGYGAELAAPRHNRGDYRSPLALK